MAYINQDGKQLIKTELTKVIPKDWKWSLSIKNKMVIVLTISQSPIDFAKIYEKEPKTGSYYGRISEYHLDTRFNGDLLVIMQNIKKAMQSANWYDNSDAQSDYFDIAYYIDINFGSWKKDYICTSK